MLFRINSNHLCLHNFGEESCSVTMPRPFKFQTGRADCVEVDQILLSDTPFFTWPVFFLRETQSLDTRRRRRKFTQILLETAARLSSSSATPLPWPAGRCCLIIVSILREKDWNYFKLSLRKIEIIFKLSLRKIEIIQGGRPDGCTYLRQAALCDQHVPLHLDQVSVF